MAKKKKTKNKKHISAHTQSKQHLPSRQVRKKKAKRSIVVSKKYIVLGLSVLVAVFLWWVVTQTNTIRTFKDFVSDYIQNQGERKHTDSHAIFVVSTEQEKLARMKNSSEVSWEMKDDPQFVVFAFDGSKSIPMWKETRAFANSMRASSTPFAFTYFINPIYLLTEEEAQVSYQPPGRAKGNSAIGYSNSKEDSIERREQISLAQREGNEIGSHGVGHWNGILWSYEDWKNELVQFDSILHSTSTLNKKSIVGFRAPELGQNDNLFIALRELGYEYDTSLVGYAKDLPKAKNGLWEFPVASIIFGVRERPVLSMDYSIYMHQTGARDLAYRGTPLWDALYIETLNSYRRYFEENYTGNHAPIYIAHHFSKWNDGVYWQVMQDFARETCIKPNVRCVSYVQLAQYLDDKKIRSGELVQ